jgi:hypothetical protein
MWPHKPARSRALLWGLWPVFLASIVVVRQSHPFRIVSDDHSYYQLATETAAAVRKVSSEDGLWAGLIAFGEHCSVFRSLPAHVNERRPVLLWIWGVAYLMRGNQGLVWTWRVLYILLVVSLFLLLTRLSGARVAALLAGVVAVAPAVQGLLSWMSCATYLVCYPLLLLGILLLSTHRGALVTLAGLMLLILAMLSREVAFLLVPGAVSLFLYRAGRKRIALVLPLLAVTLWLLLPGEGRAAMSTIKQDPVLFIRGGFLVVAGQSASLIRNLGLVFVCPLIVLLWGRFLSVGLLLAVGALFIVPIQFLLPIAAVVVALCRSRASALGVAWMLLTILAMCLYSQFSSRYAVEPLIGLTLAVGPALGTFRARALIWLLPSVIWLTAGSVAPDRLYQSTVTRTASTEVDQPLRALDMVTSLREKEYRSFAGRASRAWNHREDLRIAPRRGDSPRGIVWTSSGFWRAGSAPYLHCRRMDHVVFDREQIWEWNVWYWRVLPAQKGRGIHVELPGEAWAVHPGGSAFRHGRCLFIRPDERPVSTIFQSQAMRDWLADTPELNNPERARGWLHEVWSFEDRCQADLSSSSFRELELGRLLIRDDGWLDEAELAYLRTKVRRATSDVVAP